MNLASFFRRLEAMFGSGVPLHVSLAALARTETGELGEALPTVVRDLEHGRSFSQALARHGQVFPAVAVHLIAAGERTGALHRVLGKLADHEERALALRRRAQAALLYPAALVVSMVVLLLFLSWFVIPQEKALLRELGGELPFLTRVVLGVLDLLPLVPLVVLLGVQGLVLVRREPWRDEADRLVLRLPGLGLVLEKLAQARMLNTLATMVGSGISLTDTAEAGAAAGNRWLAEGYERFLGALRHGEGLGRAARQAGCFPPLAVALFSAAQEHGRLEGVAERLAVSCEEDVEPLLDVLAGLLEPAIILVLGVCVGLAVVAFLLPMSAALQRL